MLYMVDTVVVVVGGWYTWKMGFIMWMITLYIQNTNECQNVFVIRTNAILISKMTLPRALKQKFIMWNACKVNVEVE